MSQITLELPGMMPDGTVEYESAEGEVNPASGETGELSPEERKQMQILASQIDSQDSVSMACYGGSVQKKFRTLTEDILASMPNGDPEEINDLLIKMRNSISDFDEMVEALNAFGSTRKLKRLRKEYTKTSDTMEGLQAKLDGWQLRLRVHLRALDGLRLHAIECSRELNMHILAGRQKLEELESGELRILQQRARATRTQEDILLCSNLSDKCKNFRERLDDLDLTKTACLQAIMQIQLAQKSSSVFMQSIKSGLNNTISLWRQNVLSAFDERYAKEALKTSNAALIGEIASALKAQSTQQQYYNNLQQQLSEVSQQTRLNFNN